MSVKIKTFVTVILGIYLTFIYCGEDSKTTAGAGVSEIIDSTIIFNVTNKANKTTVPASAAKQRLFPKIFTRLHGCFMVVGWLGLTPASILIARYFKRDINCQQVSSGQLWFYVHRILMWISLVLNIFASIFIVLRIGGWSGVQFHTIFGVITIAATIVQVFGSTYFRPPLNSPNRALFNWIHWITGNLTYLLSVITIYCSLDYRVLKSRRTQILWTLNAMVILQVITVIVTEVQAYYIRSKKKTIIKRQDRDIKLSSKNECDKQAINNETTSLFKSLLLQFIIISTTVYTTAICVNILNS